MFHFNQSASAAAAGGESYRGQFAEMPDCHHPRQGIVTCYIIRDLASRPMLSSPLSSLSCACTRLRTTVRYFPVVLVPMLTRLQAPGCGAGSVQGLINIWAQDLAGKLSCRSQSILQRKLRISQDTCAVVRAWPLDWALCCQRTINSYSVLKYFFVLN